MKHRAAVSVLVLVLGAVTTGIFIGSCVVDVTHSKMLGGIIYLVWCFSLGSLFGDSIYET